MAAPYACAHVTLEDIARYCQCDQTSDNLRVSEIIISLFLLAPELKHIKTYIKTDSINFHKNNTSMKCKKVQCSYQHGM